MALYLNLYHEVQKQKLKRQRDPLKLAIMGLLLVAVGLIAWYFYRLEHVGNLKREADRVKAESKTYDAKADAAQKDLDAYEQDIKLAAAISHKMENRFYWAPLLQQIVQVIPPEIQVTQLDGGVTSDGLKKVTLTISGIATGNQPRAVAEDLRTALQAKLASQYREATAVFKSLDDGTEPVQYQGKPSPIVLFVIEVTFTSPDVDDDGKPKPPTRHPKT